MDWTFDQAENVACFTLRQIIEDGASVLLVVHDLEDHDWQFLTGAEISMDDALLVSMRQIVDHDPSLLEIGSMPPGFQATRNAVGSEWHIAPVTE